MKINELSQFLEPGVIYLVKGQSQQVRWLLPDLPIKHVIHPTTQEITRELHRFYDEDTLVIIRPKGQNVYPLRKTKNTSTEALKYGLPRKDIVPDDGGFFFICCDGEDTKSFFKKLEGGPYKVLDLTQESFDLLTDPTVLKEIEDRRQLGKEDIPEEELRQAAEYYRQYPVAFMQFIRDYPFVGESSEEFYRISQLLHQLTAGPRQFSQVSELELKQLCLDHLAYKVETPEGTRYNRISVLMKNMAAATHKGHFVPYKTDEGVVDLWGPHKDLALYLQPFLDLAATKYREKPGIPLRAFSRWLEIVNRFSGPYNVLSFTQSRKGTEYSRLHPDERMKKLWAQTLAKLENPVKLTISEH